MQLVDAHQQHINCADCSARCSSIFQQLRPEEWKILDENKTCKKYPKGLGVFTEGSFPKGLFCVREGKIKIGQSGGTGKEQIVHLAKAGDVMGYRALLSEDKYSCSAQVVEEATICFIPKASFQFLVENNPKLTLKIVMLLSNELKEAERKITATAQLPVRNRIAQAILILIDNYGFELDQQSINIVFKRSELADLAGTSRETATRILYQFQEQELIVLNGKKIKILNQELLQNVANNHFS